MGTEIRTVKLTKAKLFRTTREDGREAVYAIPYDDDADFYDFLRDKLSAGYRQVIVTSEMMIDMVRSMYMEGKYSVCRIELTNASADMNEKTDVLIRSGADDPSYLAGILDMLELLANTFSITIRSVHIRKRHKKTGSPDFFVQANGIVGINEKSFGEISKRICTVVERCVFP